MGGLEEFLNSAEPVAEEVEAPETPEAPAETAETPSEEPKGPVRDEKGRFAPKGEQPEAPAETAPPAVEEPKFDHAATIGERRRRQEAEEKLRLLEERLAKLETPQQAPPELWDDPDAYFNHRLTGVLPQLKEEIRAELRADRIKESAEAARGKYQDYDQAIDVFHELAAQNPALYKQMETARDPAEFAYSKAKTELELRQHGGLDGLIEARVKAALEKAQPAPVATPPVPDTLADAQSSRGSTGDGLHVPSFDEILKR